MVLLTKVIWSNTIRTFQKRKTFKISPTRKIKRMQFLRLGAKYMGRSRNCYVLGVRIMNRANRYSTKRRAQGKTEKDRLHESRIMAACMEHGMDKKYFYHSLAETDIALNRESLSNLSIYEPRTFQSLTHYVKMRSLEIGLQSTQLGPAKGLYIRGMDQKKKDS